MFKKDRRKFIACASHSLSSSSKEMFEFAIAKIGKWKGHVNGEFELKTEDLNQIKKNFDKQKIDVLIDLDHKTVFEGTGEAYGWVKELKVENNTLIAKVEWLKEGSELVKTKKYKYISPVLIPNTIDEVTGENIGWSLHSLALTNRPFFEDLGEIIANNKENDKKEEQNPKGEEMEKDELIKKLENENKKLKEELQELKDKKIEDKVDDAIAANKVTKEQKDSLIALAKSDYESFESFLDKAKPIIQKPQDNMYAGNKGENESKDIDVLKLCGLKD